MRQQWRYRKRGQIKFIWSDFLKVWIIFKAIGPKNNIFVY